MITINNINSTSEYYKINVCGYDKKLNLVRLESIVAMIMLIKSKSNFVKELF